MPWNYVSVHLQQDALPHWSMCWTNKCDVIRQCLGDTSRRPSMSWPCWKSTNNYWTTQWMTGLAIHELHWLQNQAFHSVDSNVNWTHALPCNSTKVYQADPGPIWVLILSSHLSQGTVRNSWEGVLLEKLGTDMQPAFQNPYHILAKICDFSYPMWYPF